MEVRRLCCQQTALSRRFLTAGTEPEGLTAELLGDGVPAEGRVV
jgi:hypothetical protein